MDPTTVFCPNGHCHARGQTGMGNIGIHSRKEQRFICHACHKTFSARKGTVFYRLRTSAETVVIVVTLLAHGCPLQAIVAAFGFDERTVAAWWARSGGRGRRPIDAGHSDAVCAVGPRASRRSGARERVAWAVLFSGGRGGREGPPMWPRFTRRRRVAGHATRSAPLPSPGP